MPVSQRTLAALLILSLSASSCVYYPTIADSDDAKCVTIIKPMKLEHYWLPNRGGDPIDIIGGFVSATSGIVSGSVVVSDNAIYWLEREVRCPNKQPVAQAANTSSQAHRQ